MCIKQKMQSIVHLILNVQFHCNMWSFWGLCLYGTTWVCQPILFGKGVVLVAHWKMFDEIVVMAADLITHTGKLPFMALWGLFVFFCKDACVLVQGSFM